MKEIFIQDFLKQVGIQEKRTSSSSFKINCAQFVMSLSIKTRKHVANTLPVKPYGGSSMNYQSLPVRKCRKPLVSPGFAPLRSPGSFHLHPPPHAGMLPRSLPPCTRADREVEKAVSCLQLHAARSPSLSHLPLSSSFFNNSVIPPQHFLGSSIATVP